MSAKPNAGSDAMGIQTRTVQDGDGYVINGDGHFISCVTPARFRRPVHRHRNRRDARWEPQANRGVPRGAGTKGFEMRRGPRSVAHRSHHNYQLSFSDCRVPARNILGEEGKGFERAGKWLANTGQALRLGDVPEDDRPGDPDPGAARA